VIEKEAKFPPLFEAKEAEGEEEEEEEHSLINFEGVEAWPGLSVKLSNSTFSVEVHLAGIMPRKSQLEEAKAFLEDLLKVAKDYHLIE